MAETEWNSVGGEQAAELWQPLAVDNMFVHGVGRVREYERQNVSCGVAATGKALTRHQTMGGEGLHPTPAWAQTTSQAACNISTRGPGFVGGQQFFRFALEDHPGSCNDFLPLRPSRF